jgi:hypothetical protein
VVAEWEIKVMSQEHGRAVVEKGAPFIVKNHTKKRTTAAVRASIVAMKRRNGRGAKGRRKMDRNKRQ